MSITSATCDSFKQEILNGVHNLPTDSLKMALYNGSASLDHTTTVYSSTNEVTGTGYTAGGTAVTATVNLQSGVATVDFSTVSWPTSTITAYGAMIYNTSHSNKAVAVISFGGAQSTTGTTFQVQSPSTGPTTSAIRIG